MISRQTLRSDGMAQLHTIASMQNHCRLGTLPRSTSVNNDDEVLMKQFRRQKLKRYNYTTNNLLRYDITMQQSCRGPRGKYSHKSERTLQRKRSTLKSINLNRSNYLQTLLPNNNKPIKLFPFSTFSSSSKFSSLSPLPCLRAIINPAGGRGNYKPAVVLKQAGFDHWHD